MEYLYYLNEDLSKKILSANKVLLLFSLRKQCCDFGAYRFEAMDHWIYNGLSYDSEIVHYKLTQVLD